jgi:ADP-ribosylglycohydrolase
MPYKDKHNILGLIDSGIIKLRMSPMLTSDPPGHANLVDPDKVEGMLLGLAAGDALGNPSESMTAEVRRSHYGIIKDYLPGLFSDGQPLGLPSDDTQMAFWTLEHLLNDSQLDPAALIDIFASRRINGIGLSVSRALNRFRSGKQWYESGVDSAGNGAIMRIAPIILPYLNNPSADLWLDTIAAAVITHNDPTSTACCIAYIDILWSILGGTWENDPKWLVDRFCNTVSELEGDTVIKSRSGTDKYSGTLSDFTRQQLTQALNENWSIETACTRWGSGAYLLETIPCMLYILCKHLDNFEPAVTSAVNATFDNDTIASLVATLIGTIHGKSSIPTRWLENLPGQISGPDNTTIYDLIEQANRKWE